MHQQFKGYRLSVRRDNIGISAINSSAKSTEKNMIFCQISIFIKSHYKKNAPKMVCEKVSIMPI